MLASVKKFKTFLPNEDDATTEKRIANRVILFDAICRLYELLSGYSQAHALYPHNYRELPRRALLIMQRIKPLRNLLIHDFGGVLKDAVDLNVVLESLHD